MDLDPSVPSLCTGVNVTFNYEPLDRKQQQIRLISVEPAAGGPIKCRLKHVILNTNLTPDFRALSYTWGAPAPVQEIIVNDRPFIVRQNLYEFLSTFRARLFRFRACDQFEDEVQWLWIDQICIAQSSVLERNHQVGLMAEIYKRASYVYVWLGLADDDLIAAMTAMKLFLREHYCRRVVMKGSNSTDDAPKTQIAPSSRSALQKFFKNPYWERLWIVQEIMLARYIRLMCGDTLLSWDELSRFCASCEAIQDQPSFDIFSPQVKWLAEHALSAKDYNYPDLLWTFAMSECENPRDRVYGLQGIVKEQDRFVINYGKSVRAVFAHAFETMTRNYGHHSAEHICILDYKENHKAFDSSLARLRSLVSGIMGALAEALNLPLLNTIVKLGDRMGLGCSEYSDVIKPNIIFREIWGQCRKYTEVIDQRRSIEVGSREYVENHSAGDVLRYAVDQSLNALQEAIHAAFRRIWFECRSVIYRANRNITYDAGADRFQELMSSELSCEGSMNAIVFDFNRVVSCPMWLQVHICQFSLRHNLDEALRKIYQGFDI